MFTRSVLDEEISDYRHSCPYIVFQMSALYTCSISGEPAEVPVVSPISGRIFEKRLIVKYINENGTDPFKNEALTIDQLVEIKTDVVNAMPRTITATSIPSMLKVLQDEWDACMLNSFMLREQLQNARQELSHTLYQVSASVYFAVNVT
ncbi:hypothetical protein WUBG_18836 [Wuchereria bancrofti]|uniref:Pre-mRNA-processing factor 19 n=1 Tax=Wuchereria bancrofti TaxID=6293 RepID=J9DLA8_WUCBA|nr:hypothetical protein WUBG_18836 [Wuchereria bancrofti]